MPANVKCIGGHISYSVSCMPRHKIPLKTRLNDYIKEFGKDILMEKFYFAFFPCNYPIANPQDRTRVTQHLTTETHLNNSASSKQAIINNFFLK